MTLVKRTNNLFPSVPSFFDDFFVKDLMGWSNNTDSYGKTLPAVNIKEDEERFEVEVAAPGLSKNDFKVEVEHDVLTISAEKEVKNDEKSENYFRKEFSYSSFRRTFSLPENAVDVDSVKASYNNGVLHILLPKREEVKPKPAKTIKIG
jgi:HSP20 family protein